MIAKIRNLFRRRNTPPVAPAQSYTVALTRQCLREVMQGMESATQRSREGIAYLIGLTTGTTTIAASARFPNAATTRGSFDVSRGEITKIVGEVTKSNLQVVGQIHTHPAGAFHSKGDLNGMRIKHPGYFSMVLPKYGSLLPSLISAHTLMWDGHKFQEIEEQVKIL